MYCLFMIIELHTQNISVFTNLFVYLNKHNLLGVAFFKQMLDSTSDKNSFKTKIFDKRVSPIKEIQTGTLVSKLYSDK